MVGGKPAILGVQLRAVDRIVRLSVSKVLGGYESIHRILINRRVGLKPCAQFAMVRASCLPVGIDSATC
jgi:hypothetical protein